MDLSRKAKCRWVYGDFYAPGEGGAGIPKRMFQANEGQGGGRGSGKSLILKDSSQGVGRFPETFQGLPKLAMSRPISGKLR